MCETMKQWNNETIVRFDKAALAFLEQLKSLLWFIYRVHDRRVSMVSKLNRLADVPKIMLVTEFYMSKSNYQS